MILKSMASGQSNLNAVPNNKKNFGLSLEEFNTLHSALINGDQRIFEKVFLAQCAECIAYLEVNDNATHADAYDATMSTLLKFRELLVHSKINYGNLRFLFTKMARQFYWRAARKNEHNTPLSQKEEDISFEENPFPDEERQLLRRAMNTLAPSCRELLKSFYFDNKNLKEIAKDLGRPHGAVRQQKSRCIKTLRSIFSRQV